MFQALSYDHETGRYIPQLMFAYKWSRTSYDYIITRHIATSFSPIWNVEYYASYDFYSRYVTLVKNPAH